MTKHYIVLGSSYFTGERVAVDFTNFDDSIINFLSELKNVNSKSYSVATHTISTRSDDWQEVVQIDPFFDNVKLLKSPEEFIYYLSRDTKITAIDVANYIASRFKCTHTRIEKLVYFCYADYLCKYKEKLFEDKIYAFKYGPVVESIYETYKGTEGLSYIEPIPKKYEITIRSRIMNSEDGINKINSIDTTLEKYKKYHTETIISFTHRDNTPWSMNDKGNTLYKEISDKDILLYHKYEEV